MNRERERERERDREQQSKGGAKRQLVRRTISILKAFARVVRGRHRFYRADLAILASHLYRGGQQISALSRKSPLGGCYVGPAGKSGIPWMRDDASKSEGDEKWWMDRYFEKCTRVLPQLYQYSHTNPKKSSQRARGYVSTVSV